MTKPLDLVGSTFNRLCVLERTDSKDGRSMWICQCSCGNQIVVSGKYLSNGTTRSCGCLQRDVIRLINKRKKGVLKRGRNVDSPNYSRWKGIKTRCYNKKTSYFNRWGGRGIRMSKEFYDDFKVFDKYLSENLGPCPHGFSLDRIDNDGHYERGNLRWASPILQSANQRQHYFNGKAKIITEWDSHIQI